MATAAPGSVLVSSTVRDLVAGSQLDLAPGGTHALKGVPGEWTLFSLVRQPDEVADPATVLNALAAEKAPRGRRRTALVVAAAAFAVAVVGVAAYAGGFFGPSVGRAALIVGIDSLGTIDAGSGTVTTVRDVPEGPASLVIGNGRLWIGSVTRSVVSGVPLTGTSVEPYAR